MYDLLVCKDKISTILKNEDYESLSYLIFEKEGLYPFAASFMINPPVLYNGKLINRNLTIGSQLSHIIITFLPGKEKTVVILAAFKDDQNGIEMLDQLEMLSDLDLEKAITSLIEGCLFVLYRQKKDPLLYQYFINW